MDTTASDNGRIARNTLLLYVRMLVVMAVGVYTSRVILSALGVTDYGIYYVVGGFVSMANVVTWTMAGALARFITFSVGLGDVEQARDVFATSNIVQMFLSALIVIVAETAGLWFLHHKLVIPPERMFAASCVFHLSVVSFVISMLAVPYPAVVTAHEEMGAFAMFSMAETLAKLAIVFVVRWSPVDRLVLYASLLCLVSWSMRIVYVAYCRRRFPECTFRYRFNARLFRSIFSFAGWNSVASATVLLREQGGNLLLNLFGGPAVNAAAGVATTLTSIVSGFTGNFTTAFNPQLIKSYARHDYGRLVTMVLRFSRLSYYLMYFLALPLFLNSRRVLQLWLGEVPPHSSAFARLVLLAMLATVLTHPLATAKSATGSIRAYQLWLGGIRVAFLALAYVALRLGMAVEAVYVCHLLAAFGLVLAQLPLVRGDIPGLSVRLFLRRVCGNVLLVTLVGSLVPVAVFLWMDDSLLRLFVSSLLSCLSVGLTVLYVGCGRGERDFLLSRARTIYINMRARRLRQF